MISAVSAPAPWWLYELNGGSIPPECRLHAGDMISTAFPLEAADEEPWQIPPDAEPLPPWTPATTTEAPRPWLAPGIATATPAQEVLDGMTIRQRQTLQAIRDYLRDYGTAPTPRDLATAMQTRRCSVLQYLRALENRGLIIDHGYRRGVELVEPAG